MPLAMPKEWYVNIERPRRDGDGVMGSVEWVIANTARQALELATQEYARRLAMHTYEVEPWVTGVGIKSHAPRPK